MVNTDLDKLNDEWLTLLKELMESNLSKNEFRVFLEQKRSKNENKKTE